MFKYNYSNTQVLRVLIDDIVTLRNRSKNAIIISNEIKPSKEILT